MRTRKRKISPWERQELRKLTLMDDDFMNLVLEDNIPCVEEMLRVILKKDDLVVKEGTDTGKASWFRTFIVP